MAKIEADYVKKVEVWWLKSEGLLRGFGYTTITWTSPWGGENSVSINVSVSDLADCYIRFIYARTEGGNDFDYKVPITTTPCRYGGVRYWFKCSLSRDGVYCGRRVGILYKVGDYFGCRHCYNLTYASRNLSGGQKSLGRIISIPEIERLRKAVKRTHYRGRETKKYKRYLWKSGKARRAFGGSVLALSERINKRT
jgi:hypothetical protein